MVLQSIELGAKEKIIKKGKEGHVPFTSSEAALS